MPDYALLNQCLYDGKAADVERMTREALAEDRPVREVLSEGLIAGMSVVGEDFKHNILYVPEVLMAARAMKAGMAVLKPLLSAKDEHIRPVGTLLMGTVRGDLHDIGKNLVAMMAEGAGFEVHDLGIDQSLEKFLAAAEKVQPDIIGMSALLTTTMVYMKTVIEGFQQAGKGHIKMAVGGAPISQMFADEIGADGYGANAAAAVDLFLRLMRGGAADASGAGAGAAAAPAAGTEPADTPPAAAASAAVGRIARVRVLRWQEIPSQVRVEDDAGNEVSLELGPKFAQRIDQLAQKLGLSAADDYLAQWHWTEVQERPGSAAEVAETVKAELEAKADW